MADKKILATVIIGALFLAGCSDGIGDRYVSFAQCLVDKKAVFYGAYWCPHCADQKAMFGRQAMKNVPYVECDRRGSNAEPELCAQKKIEGYPTWEFADGSRISGTVPLEKLAEKTACELPQEPEEN